MLGKIFLQKAIYAPPTDPEMLALNEGFLSDLAMALARHIPHNTFQAVTNAFAAYYLVLTMMLAGRLNNAAESVAFFRELIRVQAKGW